MTAKRRNVIVHIGTSADGLVVTSVMPTSLLLFAAIDLAAAVWTATAVRQVS